MYLLEEDVGLMDITTLGLGIGACSGVMEMRAKEGLVVSGCAPVKEILQELGLAFTFDAHEGYNVPTKNNQIKKSLHS